MSLSWYITNTINFIQENVDDKIAIKILRIMIVCRIDALKKIINY